VLPPLVLRAEALAAERGFGKSCSREIGRLLHVLAGSRGRERVAELGTGCGVGAAWIVSALQPQTPFLTAELDLELASAAAGLFREDPNVRVIAGDWRETLAPEAPFDLLFFDAAKQEPGSAELALGLLAPGGIALLDDLTPGRAGADPMRAFWLGDERVAAVELLAAPAEAAILAVRR